MLGKGATKSGGWSAWAALVLLALAGCSGREHSNPFDPLNPETGGEPQTARAVAGCERVALTWESLGMRDLAEIRVWRAQTEDDELPGTLLPGNPLEPTASGYVDSSAVSDVCYTYTVEYGFDGGSRSRLAPVTAQPGAALPWVCDPCGWAIARLAPDGRAVAGWVGSGGQVLDLDVDAAAGVLFMPCHDQGEIAVHCTRDGEHLASFTAIGVTCVSWSPSCELLAAGAFYEQTVSWLNRDGDLLEAVDLDGHVEDLAMSDSSTTWVALYEGDLMRLAFPGGSITRVTGEFTRAVAVADDPAGDGCWVADRAGGAVAYCRGDSVAGATAAGLLSEPLDLDATGEGTCWVADHGRGAVVLIDREGNELRRVDHLGSVAGVTYNPETGDLWVTVPEQSRVLRIQPDGSVLRLAVSGCPLKVAGDWLGGCPQP